MLNVLDGLGEWDSFDDCHKIQTSELGWPKATLEEYTQVIALERLLDAGQITIGRLEAVSISSVHASCQGVVLRYMVQHYLDHPGKTSHEEHSSTSEYSPTGC